MLVLVALALFLKWAYGRNLISSQVRTALGLLCGAVLITVGERLYQRTSRFHEAFTGAGVVALYATFFAAYNLYHLFGQTSSFFFMILTTAAAVTLALRYDAPFIAGMGIIGGFAVPYVLPGHAQHLEPVLVYDLILEAGLLLTVPRLSRQKDKLLILAVLAGFTAPAPAALGLDVKTPFWLGYFLLLTGAVVVLTRQQRGARPETARWILGILAILPFLSPVFAHRRQPDTLAQVIYLLLVFGGLLLVQRRLRPASEILTTLSTAAALMALASAAAPAEAAWWIVISVGLLAVMAVLGTARQLTGPALMALAGGGLLGLVSLGRVPHIHLAVDALFPAGMLLLSLVPIMIHRQPGPRHLPVVFGSASLFGAALFWIFNLHQLEDAHGLLMLMLAALYTAAALMASRLRPEPLLVRLTLAAAGTLFLTLFFPAQFDRATVSIAWAVEAVLLTIIGQRTDLRSIRLGGLATLLLACGHYISLDTHLFRSVPAAWIPFASSRALATAIVAGSGLAMAYLFRVRPRPGAAPLASRETTQAGALSFLAAQGILLLGLSLEIGLVFRRAAEATPAWGSAGAKQFVLTAYYALHSLSLVSLGLWRSLRGPRLVGLILFTATLCKVFLIDLWFLETLSRILSFLALGLLLVAAAFLYQKFLGQQPSASP